MPYIQIRTNSEITKEKEISIKNKFGEAITIIGKSEQWLMIEMVPNCKMIFQGEDNMLISYVDIKVYGHGSSEKYNKMTEVVSDILNTELNISKSNIYISYGEYENWGNNGRNF